MNTVDLPEPTRPNFSEEEKLNRHWDLLVVFLTGVAGYAVLHKLVIPVTLSFTALKGTPYAQVDWWFIHPVVLAYFLQTCRRNNGDISFLAGMAIVYGVYEIYEATQGRHIGWLAFSRLLSAVPLAIGSGYLMAQSRLGGNAPAAWFGALLLLIIFSTREIEILHRVAVPTLSKAQTEVPRQMPAGEYQGCGVQELIVPAGGRVVSGASIKIVDCGFSPVILALQNGSLEVSNLRGQASNLRLFIHEKGRTQTKWNILIPAHSKVSRQTILGPDAVGMLISDSFPQSGIVAIVPAKTSADWAFKRKPISIEEKK